MQKCKWQLISHGANEIKKEIQIILYSHAMFGFVVNFVMNHKFLILKNILTEL